MEFMRRYFIIVCALVGAGWFAEWIYNAAQIPGADPFATWDFWAVVLAAVGLGFVLAKLGAGFGELVQAQLRLARQARELAEQVSELADRVIALERK